MSDPTRVTGVPSANAVPPLAEGVGEFEALFALSMEMLCIADLGGFFKQVNPAFERTLGYSMQEFLSRPFLDFVHPQDQEALRAEMRKLAAGVSTVCFENRCRCRDGSWRWLSWKAASDPARQRIYAVAFDLTLQKQADAVLQESQQRYQRLLEAVTSYQYSVEVRDGISRSTHHSPGSLSATGYAPEDFAADPYLWFRIIHPDDRQRVQHGIARVLSNEHVPPLEHRLVRRDGAVRWVRDTIVLHRDAAGRLIRYDGLVEDITDRRHAEERFERLFELAPDALVLVNSAGRIELTNAQAQRVLGYTRQELQGQALDQLIPAGSRRRHVGLCQSYLAHPTTRTMDARSDLACLRKDGTEFPAEISLSPVDTERGLLICAAIRDVTERKEAERKIRESQVNLLAARRIQERMLPHHLPALPGFDIAAASFAAEFVGGDAFDYLAMADGTLGLVVSDVVGHDIGAAILMASTHAYLRALSRTTNDLSAILRLTNAILLAEMDNTRFVTAFFARLDPATRSLAYANAGHPSAYLLSASGDLKARLESSTFPLGVAPDAEFPPETVLALAPGDFLVIITDGVLEACSPEGLPYGEDRTLALLRSHRHDSAAAIVAALHDDVLGFVHGGKMRDDLTVSVVKVGA